MTANTSMPCAATTANRRARVSAIDHGLSLVTTAPSPTSLRTGLPPFVERRLGIKSHWIGRMRRIVLLEQFDRLASIDSNFGVVCALDPPDAMEGNYWST